MTDYKICCIRCFAQLSGLQCDKVQQADVPSSMKWKCFTLKAVNNQTILNIGRIYNKQQNAHASHS